MPASVAIVFPPPTVPVAASAAAASQPWPSDMPAPLAGEIALDDDLTESAGLARNPDALGPYAGSF